MADLYDVSFMNSSDVSELFRGVSAAEPFLFPAILLFEFFVIVIAGTMANKRHAGFSNVLMWCSIGSLVTCFTAFVYSFISGVINLPTLVTTIVITIGFATAYLLTDLD